MAARVRVTSFLFKTTKEMADILRIEPATLRRWAEADKNFPQPLRYNARTLRWPLPDVMAYIAARGRPRGATSR
jgi:predicted DNA-binding transcriptional regulator AlpA